MSKAAHDEVRNPQQELADRRNLIARVHQDQRATWFPLLLFSLLTFLAIPVEQLIQRYLGSCQIVGTSDLSESVCPIYRRSGLFYWPFALAVSYVVTSSFYARRSRSRGAETKFVQYIATGIVLAALLIFGSIVSGDLSFGEYKVLDPHIQEAWLGIALRLINPASLIGIALLVLARLERNFVLLIFDIFYLSIVLILVNFNWAGSETHGYRLPDQVISGCILLVGGIGFALAQSRHWMSAD